MSGDQRMFFSVFIFTFMQALALLVRDCLHPLRRDVRTYTHHDSRLNTTATSDVTVCGSDHQLQWSIMFYRIQGTVITILTTLLFKIAVKRRRNRCLWFLESYYKVRKSLFLRFTIVICVSIVSGMVIIFAFFKAFEVRRSFSAFVEDIGYVGACI